MVSSIVLAEDDTDFQLFVELGLRECGYRGTLYIAADGLELMDFLHHRGKYSDSKTPDLIILDLNMPNKDGREALHEIKANPIFRSIPIAILSSSDSDEDLQLSRDFNCPFIRKPSAYKGWVDAMGKALVISRLNPLIHAQDPQANSRTMASA